MRRTMLPGRRTILAGAAALVARPTLGIPREAQSAGPVSIVVAGPSGSRLDRWSELIAAAIGRTVTAQTPIDRRNIGGIDGVTGANQFEARGEPDGRTALLVPGSAALSWLTGETRARFDPARWVPLWAGTASAVLVSRVALTPGTRLRVAAGGPVGPELPMLLALDLLGIQAVPSPLHACDAVVVLGGGPAYDGLQPVLTLGSPGDDGQALRDPLLPSVPTVFELLADKSPPDLLAALQATTRAVQLEAGLVLPALTPAASVARWRFNCETLHKDPDLLAEAARLHTRLIAADRVASCTSAIAGSPATLLALRTWLATRYDWRPA